jgi:hypothetical protein
MFKCIKLRRGIAALVGAASLVGAVGVLISTPAQAANCETCGRGGTGGGGAGGSGGGTPHDVISFSVRTDMGLGHVTTNSGYLDRTTNQLFGTVETEANWLFFGWHDASVVTIVDQTGTLIWASPVFGPYGSVGTDPRFDNYTADVPLNVVQHAAGIRVFNYWDPQWTGLIKLVGAVGSGISAVVSFCTASPDACSTLASAVFTPLL